jgi:hypothetical protein
MAISSVVAQQDTYNLFKKLGVRFDNTSKKPARQRTQAKRLANSTQNPENGLSDYFKQLFWAKSSKKYNLESAAQDSNFIKFVSEQKTSTNLLDLIRESKATSLPDPARTTAGTYSQVDLRKNFFATITNFLESDNDKTIQFAIKLLTDIVLAPKYTFINNAAESALEILLNTANAHTNETYKIKPAQKACDRIINEQPNKFLELTLENLVASSKHFSLFSELKPILEQVSKVEVGKYHEWTIKKLEGFVDREADSRNFTADNRPEIQSGTLENNWLKPLQQEIKAYLQTLRADRSHQTTQAIALQLTGINEALQRIAGVTEVKTASDLSEQLKTEDTESPDQKSPNLIAKLVARLKAIANKAVGAFTNSDNSLEETESQLLGALVHAVKTGELKWSQIEEAVDNKGLREGFRELFSIWKK